MNLVDAQLRSDLVALYRYRSYPSSSYGARTRLYGDLFADQLVKQGYLHSNLNVAQMFWLPRCIALHDVGRLAGAVDVCDVASQGLMLLKRCELIWGHGPFSVILRDLVADYQENYAGSGPRGVVAQAISFVARFARVVGEYTNALSLQELSISAAQDEALSNLTRQVPACLDPNLAEHFLAMRRQLNALNCQFAETQHCLTKVCA